MRLGKQSTVASLLEEPWVKIVPDDELERLADEAGSSSTAAALLQALKGYRAKDRQVFAFRINEHFFVGPLPDARIEADLLAMSELDDLAS